MAGPRRMASLETGWDRQSRPEFALASLTQPPCRCLADFYRHELRKHRQCLQLQREYYSEIAILQAEDAIAKLIEQVEYLCQRDDACEVLSQLLRQFDVVTKLSAWTESERLH